MEDGAKTISSKRKIVLIGPVYPYKGGIAHYTGLMYRALAEHHDVTMISYSMQYPRFLYKKPQKDYESDTFKIDETEFLINTANPFNIAGVGRRIKKLQPDLVIIQWWHPYFAPCYRILEQTIGRHIPKLFICHNVFPHERFPMDRKLTRMVLGHGDMFICHDRSDADELLSIKSTARYAINPHPTYNAFKIQNLSKKKARDLLNIGEQTKVLLFFGFVREYKGLKYLIEAMPQIKAENDHIRLLVVGSFGDDKSTYIELISRLGVKDVIDIVDGYTPDNEVEKYFAACDMVMCPYISATQSGIVQIAYGFEKPVLATNVGGLPDVVEDMKTGYVVESQSPKPIAEAVTDFYTNSRENDFIDNIRKEAYKFSWDRMTETVETLMDEAGNISSQSRSIAHTEI